MGELFYPFSGNRDLRPERSSSYELGFERYLAQGRVEISLFWNDLRDLIVYDFAANKNENVGRARTRGIETAWHGRLARELELEAGYTYLDATDQSTGLALLRRPRHRVFLAPSLRAIAALTVSPRVTFVGRRADVDPILFGRAETPSYLRYDLFVRYELAHAAPYVRLENATDRRYDEVQGYPSPRRRWAAGLEVKY